MSRKSSMFYTCRECGDEFEIEFEFTPAEQPRLYGPPENCSPGCDAEFDIVSPIECPKCGTAVNEELARDKAIEAYEARCERDE